jgi:hypothetical protein
MTGISIGGPGTSLPVAMERDKIRVAHSHGGKLERCFDIVSSELWPGFDELFERVAFGDAAHNDTHGHARTLDTGIALMDRWIEYNSLTRVHNGSQK